MYPVRTPFLGSARVRRRRQCLFDVPVPHGHDAGLRCCCCCCGCGHALSPARTPLGYALCLSSTRINEPVWWRGAHPLLGDSPQNPDSQIPPLSRLFCNSIHCMHNEIAPLFSSLSYCLVIGSQRQAFTKWGDSEHGLGRCVTQLNSLP